MTEEFEEELKADAQQAKPLPIPAKPTPEMIAAHEVSHLPFRSCCSHSVRGRGKSFQHRRVQHDQDDEAYPVVSLDYAFFGAPGELEQEAIGGAKMPVLVVKDRFSKAMFTHLLPSKGIEHFYPESALLRDSVFGLRTVDFEVRSRTCHFGTDKRCEEDFICKRCYMSVGELTKGRCTWHAEW